MSGGVENAGFARGNGVILRYYFVFICTGSTPIQRDSEIPVLTYSVTLYVSQ